MQDNNTANNDTQDKTTEVKGACEVKSAEQLAEEKQVKTRRAFRILAVCVALYYFGSAGFSYYQEKQLEGTVITTQSAISDPRAFRENFNSVLAGLDTSLPKANANDTKEGFVAVLSPAVELRGFSKDGGIELGSVQIQTRYEGAMPPESVTAFRTFVATCEGHSDFVEADKILNALNFVPEFDKNEDDKVFENLEVKTSTMIYKTSFTKGPLDELTLIVTPVAAK